MRCMRQIGHAEEFLKANSKGSIGLLSGTGMVFLRMEDDQADARRPIVQSLRR